MPTPGEFVQAAAEDTLTIDPPPAAIIFGTNARLQSKTPTTFTPSTELTSSGVDSSREWKCQIPALFTRMSQDSTLAASESTAPDATSMDDSRSAWRLPAGEIERFVESVVSKLLASPHGLTRLARAAGLEERSIPALLDQVRSWTGISFDLVDRVDLALTETTLHLSLSQLVEGESVILRHVVPARIRKRGVERRLVLHGDLGIRPHSVIDPALLKVVARAQRWFDDLVSGQATSFKEIAEANDVSEQYVGKLIPLAFLAPKIIDTIVSGTQPEGLSAEDLTKRIDLPHSWEDQQALLGFS